MAFSSFQNDTIDTIGCFRLNHSSEKCNACPFFTRSQQVLLGLWNQNIVVSEIVIERADSIGITMRKLPKKNSEWSKVNFKVWSVSFGAYFY